ncbi:MAG: hypothetical protein HY204_07080 [Nitrospirae bacterium]|nr:hypothetical protein [Nitrospirota bacterium]
MDFVIKSNDPLFEKFVQSLKEAGIDIKEDSYPRSKYIVVARENARAVLLTHESAGLEWWGISRDIVERVEKLDDIKSGKIVWGAPLLDKGRQRGYWIPGENIRNLKRRGLATLSKKGAYHLRSEKLGTVPDMAPYFWSINGFLTLIGLNKKDQTPS